MKSDLDETFVMNSNVLQVIDREGDLWRRNSNQGGFTMAASDITLTEEELEKRFGPLVECHGL